MNLEETVPRNHVLHNVPLEPRVAVAGELNKPGESPVAAAARDCVRVGEPVFDAEELCEPFVVSLAEFRRHIRTGQLTDTDLAYLARDHIGLLGASAP